MKDVSWESYQLFLMVAQHGGLTAAGQQAGLSPATLGRRMVELERALGRDLFHRAQTGYRLTPDGEDLRDHLQEAQSAMRRVASWREAPVAPVLVRIAVGTWNAWLLSENFPALRGPRDGFRIEMNIGEQRARLAHRESDIGLRAFEPQEPNLAAVLVGDVAYAAYQARNAATYEDGRWLAVTREDAASAYLRWPHEHHTDDIVATVNRPIFLRDLTIAGAGMAVLPCFVGDLDPRLTRVGEEIVALRHRQWIVMNNDDRHRREIRTVVDRMLRFFKSHRDLYAGRRPKQG